MKKLIFILFLSVLIFRGYAQRDWWDLAGNEIESKFQFLGSTNCEPLIFKTNNNERMRLLNDKSFLGIGTTDPFATLHLHFQVDTRPCEILNNMLSPRRLLQITTPETGSSFNNGFSITSLETKEVLFEQLEQANLSIKGPLGGFTIMPNGNMGVGQSIPQAKLDVSGSFKAQSAKIINNALIN